MVLDEINNSYFNDLTFHIASVFINISFHYLINHKSPIDINIHLYVSENYHKESPLNNLIHLNLTYTILFINTIYN